MLQKACLQLRILWVGETIITRISEMSHSKKVDLNFKILWLRHLVLVQGSTALENALFNENIDIEGWTYVAHLSDHDGSQRTVSGLQTLQGVHVGYPN